MLKVPASSKSKAKKPSSKQIKTDEKREQQKRIKRHQQTATTIMASNPTKQTGVDKDAIIASLVEQTRNLQSKVSFLEEKIKHDETFDMTFEASKYTRTYVVDFGEIPPMGMPAKHVVSFAIATIHCITLYDPSLIGNLSLV